MDSPDKMDSGPSFRKISSDAANRTYRRPRSNSSPSDESPKHERNKNYSSSKSEREIEKTKSHSRSEREHDRHSDRYSRGQHDDYKTHNHNKRYDNYDYKSRSKDYRDRERKDYYNREHYSRDKEKKDYYERENEKRKRYESSSSFSHEVKPRESKFSKPENKDIEEKEKPGLSSKQTDLVPHQSGAGAGTDLNAAKAAAMKAADCVNKNIGGGAGPLTTEQKKKMLWGNKKNESTTEDITKNWDLNLFADRERQEKFNKLMGVKGSPVQESKPELTKREELEIDLEKQYTAGLRRRDGRTVGLGL